MLGAGSGTACCCWVRLAHALAVDSLRRTCAARAAQLHARAGLAAAGRARAVRPRPYTRTVQ